MSEQGPNGDGEGDVTASRFMSASHSAFQMNMMASAGPYGGPYGQSAGQGGLLGAGLSPQLQNKAGPPNNTANQFSMDKKAPPGQGLPGMVGRFSETGTNLTGKMKRSMGQWSR